LNGKKFLENKSRKIQTKATRQATVIPKIGRDAPPVVVAQHLTVT
jgi:hypothetical protein